MTQIVYTTLGYWALCLEYGIGVLNMTSATTFLGDLLGEYGTRIIIASFD
jgi:hypothetical protein